MKRPQVIMVAAAAIILALFCFTYPRNLEPHYKGRSLSRWLDIYESNQSQEAADAVRHIGTNAVPFLVTWVQQQRPLTDQLALWGFVILDGTARAAAPDLVRIATHGNDASANLATTALCYLGRDGLEPLFSVITNSDVPLKTRIGGLNTLLQMPHLTTNAHSAIALLIPCLHDPDPWVVDGAATILGALHQESGLCVPALIECTHSTDEIVRRSAAFRLGGFGPSARAAVPELTRMLSDPADSVRSTATNALQLIAPEVLQQKSTP